MRKALRDGLAVRVPKSSRFKGGWWQCQYHWNCDAPHVREHVAVERPYRVDLYVRCRRCKPCMDNRARLWMGRAGSEFRACPRNYMGTFTLAPSEHAMLDAKVALKTDTARLSEDELFAERTLVFGQMVTDWLDRIRAGSFYRTGVPGGAFRYLLVAERHDSEETDPWMRGRPHFHMLLHEQRVGALVLGDPRRVLQKGETDGEFEGRMVWRNEQWQLGRFLSDDSMIRKIWTFGFTKFEWCTDEKSAVYVCKYLTKSNAYRVRASIRYGQSDALTGGNEAEPDGESAVPRPPQQGEKTNGLDEAN